MTNTDHIKIGPETTMINLRGETEFLQNIYSTAHHTIYLLLSLVRPKDRDHGPGTSLYKKTAAIIGSGRVGKQVAKLLRAFGMIVFSYDVNDKIRPDMDFYFIHASTGNGFALGPEAIRKIASNKKKSYVINTARPELVHTNTLINNSMDLGGIAYDFEIKTPKCPFSKTNHVGGYTKEDLQATGKFCFSKLLWHIATGTNQVNRATYLVAKRSNIYNCEKGTIDSYYRWRQYVQNEK
jgi:lactate dehydrogenase-like 2-hydroxyacid dehydrogenase